MRNCSKNPKMLKKNPNDKGKKKKKNRDTKSFIVDHYAAVIEYDCGGFLEKVCFHALCFQNDMHYVH